MTLSQYTDNLYQSEVYRELERQAVKKGFFKPTDDQLVRFAAQEVSRTEQINQPIDETPSDDLIQDVARLAYAMRRKGFVTQAEDIEQKLVMYKTAENALYNVTHETNADLIGFAHRDGDVNLIEGSGDLGAFETMQSIADKILAVTRKQPTGQQPINRMAALADMINKVAQDSFSQELTGKNQTIRPKTKREVLDAANAAIKQFDESRKNPPSYDDLYFNDLENNQNQRNAYVYFSGNRVNIKSIAAWYNIKNIAKNLGVLVDANIPYIDTAKLYNLISGTSVSFTKEQALLNNTQSLVQLATAMGVLPTLQSTYLSETGSMYLLAGGFQVGLNSANGKSVCEWLARVASNRYNSAFGEQNSILAAAQETARNIPENLYKKIEGIKIIENSLNVNVVLRSLIKISRDIDVASSEFLKNPEYNHLVEINKNIVGEIVRWVNGLKNNIVSAYSDVSTDQTKPLNMDMGPLNKAYEIWANKDDSNSQDIAEKIQTLIGIVEKYNDQPWVELQDALAESPLKITEPTRESFQRSVQSIIDSARR